VKRVREREMTAGTIARQFKLSRAAVSQHVAVRRQAGLLDERRVGTQRLYVVRAKGFDELVEFIGRVWQPQLRSLKKAAEAAERKQGGTMTETGPRKDLRRLCLGDLAHRGGVG
jgi:DNA-binding transcriptional ArsR family regulator